MALVTIFCKSCWAGYASLGEIPAICPNCEQETTWTTFARQAGPTTPYRLTVDDRRFLRETKIRPD